MTRATKIDFATGTLPVVTGCSKDGNAGCKNCYAAFQVAGRLRHLPSYEGLAFFDKNGDAQWTGKVRCNEFVLTEPLRTKRPQRYFVAPRGDLFHSQVPDEFLDKFFAVASLSPQHIFMIFTKRAERRRDYLSDNKLPGRIAKAALSVGRNLPSNHPGWKLKWAPWIKVGDEIHPRWPLPNVWQITSVWDQESANRLIPPTLETPAAVRGVSIAPMLWPVDLENIEVDGGIFHTLSGTISVDGRGRAPCNKLDWIIVEGESGKNARPMHPDWVRGIRDQCAAASVPLYFKQWGEYGPNWLNDDAGNKIAESEWMDRMGKKKAGCRLDGIKHLEFPK